MGYALQNVTFRGTVGNAVAILTITSSNEASSDITAGRLEYNGTAYNIRGKFYYADLSNDTSPVTLELDASLIPGNPPGDNPLKLNLHSDDRFYSILKGELRATTKKALLQVNLLRQ